MLSGRKVLFHQLLCFSHDIPLEASLRSLHEPGFGQKNFELCLCGIALPYREQELAVLKAVVVISKRNVE